MKTLRTLAVMFVACLVCLPAYGRTNDSTDGKAKLVETWNAECFRRPNLTDKQKTDCKKLESMIGSAGGGDSCKTADADYKAAYETFTTACSSFGGGDLHECGKKMRQCRCLNKSLSGEEKTKLECDSVTGDEAEESESARGGSSSARSLGLINMGNARKQLTYCPQMSAADGEKFEKKLEKTEDKLKDLKKSIPELQAELAKVDTDLETNLEKIEEEQTRAADDHAKELEQAAQEKDQKQKELMNQVTQLQTQIGQSNEQVGAVELAKIDAFNGLNSAKNKVNLECVAQASNVVGKMQTDALEQIKTGSYNVGGQADLFQRVGLSDRESWQRVARKYQAWCLESEAVNMQKSEANTAYEAALRKANQSKADLIKRKEGLQQQIEQIKSSGGCGAVAYNSDGTTNESEMCKANRQTAEKMQRLEAKYQQAQVNAQRKQQRAQMAADQKRQQAYMKLMQAQQEMMDEQRRLANLKEYLDLRMDKGLGGADKEAAKNFNLGWTKILQSAANLDSCCADNDVTSPNCGADKGPAAFLKSVDGVTRQTSAASGLGGSGTTPPRAPSAPRPTDTRATD